MIKFSCENCGRKIRAPEIHAGKKGKCPKCKNIVVVPKPEDIGSLARRPTTEEHVSDKIAEDLRKLEERKETEQAEPEPVGERKLPWLIDIFLYPISASGLVHLAILSFLPRMLLPLGHLSYWRRLPILGLGLLVIFGGYLFYCLSDCIRDSAVGGQRAPNIDISLTVLLNAWELIRPILNTFVCVAVCVGPLFAYFIITRRTDLIFWLLVTYGVLFLPMVLMATVLFDSLRALNPVLIIASAVTVFLPYCGLVLLFFAVGGLVAIIMAILPQSRIIGYILSAVCIYLTMVVAHLLGRFYWRYQEKLNWEV